MSEESEYKVEMVQNQNGAWFWHLASTNGEILANSEAYSSKGNCKKTASKIAKKLGTTVEVVE